MSWAFITALKKNPQQSYVQLLNSIREELESKYTQKPQLSCSHPLSKSLPSSDIENFSSARMVVDGEGWGGGGAGYEEEEEDDDEDDEEELSDVDTNFNDGYDESGNYASTPRIGAGRGVRGVG